MAPIHNRMPVILSPASYDQWLDPTFQHVECLTALLRPNPSEELTAYPVSTLGNNPRQERFLGTKRECRRRPFLVSDSYCQLAAKTVCTS